jgi:xylan 1,4-beta-xylosidase
MHETLGRVLTILSCPGDYPEGSLTFPVGSGVAVGEGPLELAAEVCGNDLRFFWRPAGAGDWQAIGPVLDAGVVSDEGGRGEHGSFTGAFVGMFAFDITGRAAPADFARFAYTALS